MPEVVVRDDVIDPPVLPPTPIVPPPIGGNPPVPFATWCDWARAGLQNALTGMSKSGSGVSAYHIGSRGLKRVAADEQIKNVDYWNQMVVLFCGDPGLPSSLTGRDTACRIIPRDV